MWRSSSNVTAMSMNQLWVRYNKGQGVFWEKESLCFVTAVRKGNTCSLLLFGKNDEKAEKKVPMKQFGNSRLFSVRLSKADVKNYSMYCFMDERGTFEDEYATAIAGREHFGLRKIDHARIIHKENSGEIAGFTCPAFSSLLFYKLHVRGFTKSKSSGVKNRGTFAGLAEKIPYLKELGVNAVLLMPVYEFDECMTKESRSSILSEETMAEYEKKYGSGFVDAQMGYSRFDTDKVVTAKLNYWGYSAGNYYFAPKASYASKPGRASEELKETVNALHAAGIAVFYEFYFSKYIPQSRVLSCLYYWTTEFGADGFRLMGDRIPMQMILEDDYLSGVKFLVSSAEGTDSSQNLRYDERRVAIYNDDFRNAVRKFVKGDENTVSEFVQRSTEDRRDFAQISYVSDQNGFTLYDLYTYDRKHNEENGEENRDGEDYNFSWNCGAEGETTKKKIRELRTQLRKNALCTVLLSQKVPLIFAGDELCHTQKGNNNAYCQDNEIGWMNWRMNKERKEQLEFFKQLVAFRKGHALLCGGRQPRQDDLLGVGMPELSLHGVKLWQPDFAPYSRTISLVYCGAYDVKGEEKEDICLLFNMHWEQHEFLLPCNLYLKDEAEKWQKVIDTSGKAETGYAEDFRKIAVTGRVGEEMKCMVPPRSVVVLIRKGSMECLPQRSKM